VKQLTLVNKFARQVLSWYDESGRKSLPWKSSDIPKEDRPYHIWLSEVMLQQTQVVTVIPYYQKFIASFPNLKSLAVATQDNVLAHWSGLGYYARGRNLHKAAGLMWKNFQSVPNDFDELLALPGIGRSTAGAIMAQAFDESFPILDGNVKRVLARYYLIEGWYGKSTVGKQFWSLSEKVTPVKRIGDYTQAIMDLGALVCKRGKPKCNECPLSQTCSALKTDRVSELPTSKPKKNKPVKQIFVACIIDKKKILLEQRPPSGIWGGLWSFPEFDSVLDMNDALLKDYGIKNEHNTHALNSFRHTFSHYHLDIHPHVVHLSDKITLSSDFVRESTEKYFPLQQELKVGIAAPVKQILEDLSHLIFENI